MGGVGLTLGTSLEYIRTVCNAEVTLPTQDFIGSISLPTACYKRLFGNETTSLCMPAAWREFRTSFQVLGGQQPALILLSTDGLANSFLTEEAFVKVGPDILEAIRSDGLEYVDENLESWLNEYSRLYSGDDISLGILCRMESMPAPVGSKGLETSKDSPAPVAGDLPRSHSELEP